MRSRLIASLLGHARGIDRRGMQITPRLVRARAFESPRVCACALWLCICVAGLVTELHVRPHLHAHCVLLGTLATHCHMCRELLCCANPPASRVRSRPRHSVSRSTRRPPPRGSTRGSGPLARCWRPRRTVRWEGPVGARARVSSGVGMAVVRVTVLSWPSRVVRLRALTLLGCVCARACNNNDAVQTTFTELSELLVVEVPSPVQGPPTAVYVRLYLACDPLPTEPPAAEVMAAVLAAFGEFDGCVRGRD